MTPFADSYALAPDAQALLERLRAEPLFAHTAGARLVCVASERTPVLHGWACHAWIAEPRVQGPFKWWFEWALAQFAAPVCAGELPHFVVLLDAALWPAWGAEYRERVIFHELKHLVQKEHPETGAPMFHDDGTPLLQLRPHDYEFFADEVERYGPELCALDTAAVAIAHGFRAAERRKRRVA